MKKKLSLLCALSAAIIALFVAALEQKNIFHGGSALIQRIQVGCFICNQLHHKGANLIRWRPLLDVEQVRRSQKQIGLKKLVLGNIQNSS